jgi:uncharacterized protein YigE (DUF2233 family)
VTVDLDRGALGLHWKRPDGSRYGNFADLKADLSRAGEELLFATNAGIFEPRFVPTGLHVEGGRELVPLNPRGGAGNFYLKPNGVFCVTDAGAGVVESGEYAGVAGPVRLATQSGPLLVRGGQLHPALHPDSPNRAIRSAVGVPSPRSVVFALSDEPVTFYELATLLRDPLGCADALYLDGTISRFYLPERAGAGPMDGEFAGMLATTRRRGNQSR